MSAPAGSDWWLAPTWGAPAELCGTLHAASPCYDVVLTLGLAGAGPSLLSVLWLGVDGPPAVVSLRLSPPLGRIA